MACGRTENDGAQTIVGGLPLHDTVVASVAARDGVDADTAREHVTTVLRLAAAAGVRTSEDVDARLTADRAAHLRRSARARLWLREVFEPAHTPDDISDRDPLLRKALEDPRFVHPRVHRLCQLVAVPSETTVGEDDAHRRERAADPSFRAEARRRVERVAARMRRYTSTPGHPDPCKTIQGVLTFEAVDADGVRLAVESGGFVLEACAREDEAGRCSTPRWDPTWTEHVGRATGPGWLPPFETPFGVHVVYVDAILPERRADDPEARGEIRRAIHPHWQRTAYTRALEVLREHEVVRIAREDVEG